MTAIAGLLKENKEMYALMKELFVTSERARSMMELPASRQSIEGGEIQRNWKNTAPVRKIPTANQADFIQKRVC